MTTSGAGNAVLGRARAFARRPATTLARLQLLGGLLALAAIACGAIAAHAAATRRQAVRSVLTNERLLKSAVDLSASLSDAHAIAALSFLAPGSGTVASRGQYARALQQTSDGVSRLAAEIGDTPAGAAAVRSIARDLTVYTEYVQGARDNTRQGAPVGSAYLRAASRTRGTVLQQARGLYEIEANNLTASYRTAVSSSTAVAVAVSGGALLALLIATQLYLARATRRILNPRLVLATALLLGLGVWTLVAFAAQERALGDTQRDGSDRIELLTAAAILALRAQADESTALAARGGGEGEPRLDDVDRGFQAVTRPIPGLLAQAGVRAGAPIERRYRAYLDAHGRVAAKERVGDFDHAIDLAVGVRAGDARTTRATAAALNGALQDDVRVAERRFHAAAGRAHDELAGLVVGIPLLTALGLLLALSGLRQRLAEYR